MSRIVELYDNMKYVYAENGPAEVGKRLLRHGSDFVNGLIAGANADSKGVNDFVDVLFINGCDYSVPIQLDIASTIRLSSFELQVFRPEW